MTGLNDLDVAEQRRIMALFAAMQGLEGLTWMPAHRELALSLERPYLAPQWLKEPAEGELVLIVTCVHSLMGPAFMYFTFWVWMLTGRYPLTYQVPGGGWAFTDLDDEMRLLLRQPDYGQLHAFRVLVSKAATQAVASHVSSVMVIGHAGATGPKDECIELSYRVGLDGLSPAQRDSFLDAKLASAVDNLFDAIRSFIGTDVPVVGWLAYLSGSQVSRLSEPKHHVAADHLISRTEATTP